MREDARQVGCDRHLIEEAVKLLLAQVPSEWTRLHGEFELSPHAQRTAAYVATPDGGAQPVVVADGVVSVLAEHQRRSAMNQEPWRRLVIDCDADGRLSVQAEPGGSGVAPRKPRQSVVLTLAGLTGACLVAAAVVFALGWRWGPPPRLGMIAVAPDSPRQQEAFAVVSRWYEAERGNDVGGMQAVVCAQPAESVVDWISSIGYYGQDQGLVFPDAVTGFRDDGARVWVKVAVRIRPVDERTTREVRAAQGHGGFLLEEMTLADESGELKVCDIYVPSK